MSQKPTASQEIFEQAERVRAELNKLEHLLKFVDPTVATTDVTSDWIKGVLEARRRRDLIFGEGIFADPGWDLLLATYALQLANERGTITDVCRLAHVRGTTGLRWARQLARTGLIVQKDDEHDGRLVLLELSVRGVAAMQKYFVAQDPSGLGV